MITDNTDALRQKNYNQIFFLSVSRQADRQYRPQPHMHHNKIKVSIARELCGVIWEIGFKLQSNPAK
jgi:hypothetical protein